MTIPLKLSTTSQQVPLGVFVDSTDGDTEETGLTIANTDIKLWKHGEKTLANKNIGGATHMSNGIYYCVLDDKDTNTLGGLEIFVHVSGARVVKVNCIVYPAKVYDSIIGGTDNLEVDAVQISGDSTAADNLELQYDTTGLSGDTFPSSQAQVATVDGVVDAILVDTSTTLPADIAALNNISVADIIAGITDGTFDLQEMMRIILAATAGKSSGGGTVTLVFRDAADTKARITATVDTVGNRTAMVLDGV